LKKEGVLNNASSATLALRALAHLSERESASQGGERDEIITRALVHLLEIAEADAQLRLLGVRGHARKLWEKAKNRIKDLTLGKS
jgi:hypothetical protein